MRRRDFLRHAVAASGAIALPRRRWIQGVARGTDSLLVPMDDAQQDHLKAYGLAFRSLGRGDRSEWWLNYRSGSFLVPASDAVTHDAALAGVTLEPIDAGAITDIRGQILAGNMESVPLEKLPKIAVYAPPDAAPWDDAVTMVLNYAGVEFKRVWDPEVMAGDLAKFDWLHLHHEDFTGQYSKFALTSAGAPWLQAMMQLQQTTAARLGFANGPDLKRAVAQNLEQFVTRGGFLFAMCTATETLDLALASQGVDIAAAYADGTPMDPLASSKMHWDKALAFHDAQLELSPSLAVFSDIDGHQVNTSNKQPLGAFTLFNFAAKIDPVATMLVQNHRQVIPDFYGVTTSFRRTRIKPEVVILADEPGAPWAKYLHGEHGRGTWTFFGGHDPEDPEHAIGNAPTDLSLHPHSPGYRLILNNVLFPAAKKKELKT
ncbi:MAG TPA: hypothetical protein VGM77_12685 [Gemmatimonadales bacterium]